MPTSPSLTTSVVCLSCQCTRTLEYISFQTTTGHKNKQKVYRPKRPNWKKVDKQKHSLRKAKELTLNL